MALSVNVEISGQEATSTCSYCYLYEPLKVAIFESNTLATTIFIDLELVDTSNSSIIVENLIEYCEFDINSGEILAVDLMQIARQHHDANVFKFSNIGDLINGFEAVVSKYKYRFKIYSDVNATPVEVFKLPIIGGRLFKDFAPYVSESQSLTEADLFNVDLENRWCNYGFISTVLASPTAVDSRPLISTNFDIEQGELNDLFVGIDESESGFVGVDESESGFVGG